MDSDDKDSGKGMSEFQEELADLIITPAEQDWDLRGLMEKEMQRRREHPLDYYDEPPLTVEVIAEEGENSVAVIGGEWVEVSNEAVENWFGGIGGGNRIKYAIPLVNLLPHIVDVDSVNLGCKSPSQYSYDDDRGQILLPTDEGLRVWQKRVYIANFTNEHKGHLRDTFWDWGFRFDGDVATAELLEKSDTGDVLTLALCLDIRDAIIHLRYREEFDAILIDKLSVGTLYAYVIASQNDLDVYLLTETPVKSITGNQPETAFSLERLLNVAEVNAAADECWGAIDGYRHLEE